MRFLLRSEEGKGTEHLGNELALFGRIMNFKFRLERDDGYRCLSMTHLIKWAYQIAQAVKYLHRNNV